MQQLCIAGSEQNENCQIRDIVEAFDKQAEVRSRGDIKV